MSRTVLLVLFIAWAGGRELCAHTLGEGYVFLSIHEDRLAGRLDLLVDDLARILPLDADGDGKVAEAEIERHKMEIASELQRGLGFTVAGETLAIDFDPEPELFRSSLGRYVTLGFRVPALPPETKEVDITYDLLFANDPSHQGLLIIESNERTGAKNTTEEVSLRFDSGNRRRTLDLTGKHRPAVFAMFLKSGVHHIWVGIDHVLFLIALLLPAVLRRREGRWVAVDSFRRALWNVVEVVTVFTLAHSVTLSLGALDVVRLPGRVVEPLIAISIAIAALDLIFPVFRGRIWIVVFGFGLFHGFGFASLLADLGLKSSNLLAPLVGFNVGVELGQLAIVIGIFPLLWFARSSRAYPRAIVPVAACALIGISLYWFVERAFDVTLFPWASTTAPPAAGGN